MIEAKGTYYGVVTSNVSAWNAWGEMKGVDYGDVADSPTVDPTPAEQPSALGTRLLKRTSPYMRGDDAVAQQTDLTAAEIAGLFSNNLPKSPISNPFLYQRPGA